MNALSTKNTNKSEERKINKFVFPLVLFVISLIAFLPSLMALSRLDELFQMQWLQSCFQSGLFTGETAHFLLSQAPENADNQGIGPRLFLLLFALISAFNIQISHLWLVVLHAANASLLFFLVKKIILTLAPEERDKIAHGFTATVAALLYLLSPLAVEPVSWLSGAPYLAGNTLVLLCANFFLCQTKFRAGLFLLPLAQLVTGKYLMTGLLPLFILLTVPGERKGFKSLSSKERSFVALSAVAVVAVFALNLISSGNHPLLPEGRLPSLVSRLIAVFVPVPRPSMMPTIDHTLLSVLPLLVALVLIAARLVSGHVGRSLLACLVYILAYVFFTDNFTLGASVYGARWLHGLLPVLSIFLATLFTSAYYFHSHLLKDNLRLHIYRELLTGALALAMLGDCLYITLYQCQKVSARGKLFKTIMTRVKKLAPLTSSPYLVVKDLPRELTLAPFLPQDENLIALDKQDGMPVSPAVSIGPTIDNLRKGKSPNNLYRYSAEFTNLAPLDFNSVPASLPHWFNAEELSRIMTPPMSYSKGAITFDQANNLINLVGREKSGAALGIEDLQISPLQTDCFYLDAMVEGQIDSTVELHWLTNFYTKWDGNGRHLVLKTSKSDNGMYKHFAFNLRNPTWLANGFITDFMVGLPANATVKLKGMGFVPASTQGYQPTKLTCRAKLPQANKRHFTEFCKNYPDSEELGLVACYGQNNALVISASAADANAQAVKRIKIVLRREEQDQEQENTGEILKSIESDGHTCQAEINLNDLKIEKDAVLVLRAQELSDTGTPIGLESDPIYVLVSKGQVR